MKNRGTFNPYTVPFKALAGRVFTVREAPQQALARAGAVLEAEGFHSCDTGIDLLLEQRGSPWSVAVMRIGGSPRAWMTNALFEALPVPGIRPAIPATFGVAAARSRGEGTTELVVMPILARSSVIMEIVLDNHSSAAKIHFLPALDALLEEYEREGLLVEVSKPRRFHPDKECPAAEWTFKRLLKESDRSR